MNVVVRNVASLAVLIAALVACGSNITHIDTARTNVPDTRSFDGSMDTVWAAAKRALSADATFKALDRSSGIMVTEFRTIDAEELSIAQTVFLGKTYKSSYTVNFNPATDGKTDVTVNVKLQAVQVGFFSREESNEGVESYLRQALFDKIATNMGHR
ncbi:MAG: hypothetical protein M3495_10825 [Pseudomonadota bacterium]|nr:hypothetical protein [Pseudomonadota bacterium]